MLTTDETSTEPSKGTSTVEPAAGGSELGDLSKLRSRVRDESELGEFLHRFVKLRLMGAFATLGIGFASLAIVRYLTKDLTHGVIAFIATTVLLLWMAQRLPQFSDLLFTYKHGLVGVQPDERHVVWYDEIEELTVKRVDHFHNGFYTHTADDMNLRLSNGRSFNHVLEYRKASRQASRAQFLVQQISSCIVRDMLAKLTNEGRARWTENIDFVTDGIEYRVGPSSTPEHYAFSDVVRAEFIGEEMKLHLSDNGMPTIISQESRASNFFPGYFLLQKLVQGITSA